jgi:hypothetical protein
MCERKLAEETGHLWVKKPQRFVLTQEFPNQATSSLKRVIAVCMPYASALSVSATDKQKRRLQVTPAARRLK